MVCDFGFIRESVQDFLAVWDHARCVNSADPACQLLKDAFGEWVVVFENLDPTTEVMAKKLFDTLKVKLEQSAKVEDLKYQVGKGVKLVRVRIWETSSSWAEYGE